MTTIQKYSKTKFSIIAALSAIGAAITVWQTQMFFSTRSGLGQMHSFCNINATFDCTAVEMSRYSELWAGFPLSGLGIAGYLVILGLAFFGMNEKYAPCVKKALLVFSGIAVAFSAVYLFIMLALIGKLCLLCLAVDAINIALFIVTLTLPTFTHKSDFSLKHLAGIGITALFITLLITKAVDPQAEVKKEDLNDMVESVMSTPAVQISIPADVASIGPADAPITIVKFSDFQCPGCKMAANAIHPLMKRYEKQVRFVFVNYPLDSLCNPEAKHRMHPFACEAAAVGVCAQAQGKYINAYELLFENQQNFAEGKIADILSGVPGLNLEQLKSCMTQASTSERIKNDVAFGTAVKIMSTPTFFINGKKIEGGLPTSLWIDVIDRLLKK